MNHDILRQIRFLKIYAAAMTLALVALLLMAFTESKQKFSEIDVERVNIIDDQGKRHLVISSPARFPDPVVNGQQLKGMRSIKPAGIAFYDPRGNEIGGIGTAQTKAGKVSLMAFDYSTAEAIGFNRFESEDGVNYSAGFMVLDPPPPGTKLEEAARRQQTRAVIQTENKDTRIVLADADGRERIKLMVDRKGDASIQILDANGKVVFSAPNKP